VIPLRFPGNCAKCGAELEKGTLAYWDADHKLVYCLAHLPADAASAQAAALKGLPGVGDGRQGSQARAAPVDFGVAGASAQREYDRRVARRERRVRAEHPVIGGALLALFGDPQPTVAWSHGATGERAVGRRLEELRDKDVITVHDRKVPRSSANIDHIAVGPSGVYVIDAKYRETGRVTVRRTGLFGSGPRQLWVGGRNCTGLVEKMPWQVDVVKGALSHLSEAVDLAVRPMLTFVNADWGLFPSAVDMDGVLVVWPKEMAKVVSQPGDVLPEAARRVAEHLARVLKPA